MVEGPGEYQWSSYRSNGLGLKSKLVTAHEEYLRLGRSEEDRLSNYRSFFIGQVDSEVLKHIRQSTHKGLVIGNNRFAEEIEMLAKRRATPAQLGRPFKGK